MSLTTFGKEARKLRIDHDLSMHDVAVKVGVSAAFISALEAGRKAIPPGFVQRVSAAMGLSKDEAERLQAAADQSAREQRITFGSSTPPIARETVTMLARNFDDLTAEQFEKIRSILGER